MRRPPRFAAFLLALLGCLWLRLPAHGLTFTDDFADSQSTNVKSYTNLAAFPMDASYWSALPDRTAFSFASASTPTGVAAYQVRGAEQISVGLYTLSGSFAVQEPGGDWVLGLYSENTAALAGKSLRQAGYSPSARAVYATIGGALHKAHAGDAYTVFAPTGDTPSDLVGYGVNVYSSVNGQSWSRVSLTQAGLAFQPGSPFVYEELTGPVPAGTAFLLVELNDVNHLPILGKQGSYMQKTGKSYNCLASVRISGGSLALGAAEPVLPEPTVPHQATEPATEASSSGKSTQRWVIIGGGSASAAAGKTESSASKSASSKFEGSKFEGVIESSSGGRKSGTSSGASSRSQAPSSYASRIEPTEPEEPPRHLDDGILYQIGSKNGDDKTFTAAVIVYIIVVTVALAFLVLASAAKKQ